MQVEEENPVKWKKQCGAAASDDSDLESIDGENNPNVFTTSNEQSYAKAKSYRSKQAFDKTKILSKFLEDSDE